MATERRENGNNAEVFESEDTPLNPGNETAIEPATEERRTCKEKLIYFFKNVTLEPTVMLYITAYMIATLTTTNLSLEKACRVNLNFTDEICTAMREQRLDNQNPYEREAQRLVASALPWKTYITATVPCVIGLFVGPWQDVSGRRKIFLIIPIFGLFLSCINSILHVVFFYQLNLQALVLSEAAIEALSGGMCIMVITIFSYIASITTNETRTFRMGMINFSLTVGFPIGIASSGFLLKNLGYFGAFGMAAGIHSINLLYNTFVLKDPPRTSEQKQHDNRGFRHFCRTFFDLSNIKQTMKVVFGNEPKRRRLRIIVLLVVVTFLFGPMFGEMSVLYMSTRYRFNWDEVRFSLFQTYNFVTHTIGTVFSITVLSRYLQWHDSMLGIISTISKIAASFIYCFAPNEKYFFIAPLVEILNGTALLAIRSITSKLVATNELGKMNSIFGLTENLMPLVYVPMYTVVYTATMEILPGAIFLLSAIMTFPAFLAFIWLFVEYRRKLKKKPLENGEEEPKDN